MDTSVVIIGVTFISLVLFLIFIAFYNGLVAKRNMAKNAFATIDVMLKKRHDLIPNLVATVKNYMTHEKDLLTKVTELRSQAMNDQGKSTNDRVNTENQISATLSKIILSVENYPALKADKSFEHLQRSLNETEEQISAARRTFNAAVTELSNSIEMFPSSVIASIAGFKQMELLSTPENERKNVDVGNLFGNK